MRNTLTGTAVAPPRAKRSTLVGSVFDGRYEISEKIAAGGFGAIYRAIDLTTGMTVALKVLHADLASDASLAARFRREAEVLAMLRDPRTVAMYHHGETDDGTLYLALELLSGETLEARFARGTMTWRETLQIVREVCSALIEAHRLGVVHRDLKPGNVFLAREGVKVIDFGIAKVNALTVDAGITRIGQAIGTLDYMGPEQLVGGECDGRTDIYTLGVVAYEAICGARPFADAAGATGLITALLTRTPLSIAMRVPAVPAEVDAIIMKCLEREPEDRFDATELAAAIDRVLAPVVECDEESTVVDMSLAAMIALDVTAPAPKLAFDTSDLEPSEGGHGGPPHHDVGSAAVFDAKSTLRGVTPRRAPEGSAAANVVFAEGTVDGEQPILRARTRSFRCLATRIALAAAVALASGAAILAMS